MSFLIFQIWSNATAKAYSSVKIAINEFTMRLLTRSFVISYTVRIYNMLHVY